MSQLEPLAAAVCEAPDDLARRRAYALAARATDPDRAAFIELQLEHHAARQRGEEPDDRSARDLVQRHGPTWAGPHVTAAARRYAFYAGFVELVEIEAARLLANATTLVQHAPLRHLRVRKLKGQVAALAHLPLLGQVVSLDVAGCQLDDADVAALVASPHLRGLRLLTLSANPLGVDALRAVGHADLPSLKFVDADSTDAALVVRASDWDGSTLEVSWTRARTLLRGELGARPWLDHQHKPHVDAL